MIRRAFCNVSAAASIEGPLAMPSKHVGESVAPEPAGRWPCRRRRRIALIAQPDRNDKNIIRKYVSIGVDGRPIRAESRSGAARLAMRRSPPDLIPMSASARIATARTLGAANTAAWQAKRESANIRALGGRIRV